MKLFAIFADMFSFKRSKQSTLVSFIKVFVAIFVIYALWPVTSCTKNNDDPVVDTTIVDIDSGRFLAVIDEENWHPVYHSAVYYPKWNQLFVVASGKSLIDTNRTYELYMGINLTPASVLQKYLLEPNGTHTARLVTDHFYYSDHNIADAGGSFTLSEFDTVAKKISGSLQFTAYRKDATKKKTLTSTIIEHLPLKIDTSGYSGNNGSCTIAGVTTTNWQSKNIYARVDCISNNRKKLSIGITSVMKEHASGRSLTIAIPLDIGKGTYPLYPALPPYFYCGDNRLTATYCDNNFNARYFAESGTLTISVIDTALKKLSATFSIKLTDTTSRKGSVTITNGAVNLNTWREMDEP